MLGLCLYPRLRQAMLQCFTLLAEIRLVCCRSAYDSMILFHCRKSGDTELTLDRCVVRRIAGFCCLVPSVALWHPCRLVLLRSILNPGDSIPPLLADFQLTLTINIERILSQFGWDLRIALQTARHSSLHLTPWGTTSCSWHFIAALARLARTTSTATTWSVVSIIIIAQSINQL